MPISETRIERALRSPSDFDELLDRADQANLAERLDEALHGGAPELTSLARQLGALVSHHAGVLPSQDENGSSDSSRSLRLAYQAGLLGFAQLLAAQAADKRAPDRVQDVARSARLSPYMAELRKGDQTNSQLAELMGETEETVSRKLKKLRRYGLTAFRRDGRVTANYLTPLGRLLTDAPNAGTSADETERVQVNESKLINQVLVKRMESAIPIAAHLQDLPILGGNCDVDDRARYAHGR